MIDGLLTQTVTVVRMGETATDNYGNTELGEQSRATAKGRLEQTDAQEATVGRDTQVANWRLFLLPTVGIDGNDRIEWDGKTFEVVGPPETVYRPQGAHHKVALLRHVQG